MIKRRIKMALLAFRRPELVAPALTLTRAIALKGMASGMIVVKERGGIKKYYAYTVVGKAEMKGKAHGKTDESRSRLGEEVAGGD